jgi:hypothetical protein
MPHLNLGTLRTPTLQELFNETGDMHYVAMAIGENPKDPPAWAIEACQSYYFARQIEVESTGKGRPPAYSVEDGLQLVEVATIIVEEEVSLTAAVRRVTKQEMDGSDFRRLMRIWKRHLHLPALIVAGKPKKTNKWLELARKRKWERYFKECTDQALAEIAAGNFNIDIDPVEEADRLKRAEWIILQSTKDPNQEGRIKIAPASKERHIIALKKLLLERMKGADKTS